jgi:hypothetical protein
MNTYPLFTAEYTLASWVKSLRIKIDVPIQAGIAKSKKIERYIGQNRMSRIREYTNVGRRKVRTMPAIYGINKQP